MQFRDHPGVQGKRDAYPFDPRLLKIDAGYNVRDLEAPDERDDLNELKESIRTNGVRVPLEVRLIDENVFVVSGHRRHKAVMELIAEGEEIKAVPVMPEPKHTSEVDRILNLVVSNSGKPLKPLEIAEVVRRLIAFGWEKQQIAKRLGWKSPSTVTQHLDMLALPEGVKEQVRENVISATEATKVLKNLPAGTDPAFASDLIKSNQEENKKLGVGAKNNHKVTAKTLKRDASKTPSPAKVEAPHPQLQETAAREAPRTNLSAFGRELANAGKEECERLAREVAPPISQSSPFANIRIEAMLSTFLAADVILLADRYARLVSQLETAKAEDKATPTQEQLCVAANVIGALRFPDEWEQAKANTELAAVA
jgi:ParB/RepB/Spo0J family partition protein